MTITISAMTASYTTWRDSPDIAGRVWNVTRSRDSANLPELPRSLHRQYPACLPCTVSTVSLSRTSQVPSIAVVVSVRAYFDDYGFAISMA